MRRCGMVCVLAVVFGGPVSGQPKVTYDQHVLPVLRDKCLSCHNADKARGGLDASSYGKLMEGGSSGAVVKPGDVDGSRLYTLSAHKEEPKMPPNSPAMPGPSLEVFKAWIESGAPENAGSKAAVTKKADLAVKSAAFTRPAVAPLPEKKLNRTAVRTPHANAVTALAASPWAPLFAVAAPKQVLLYHADTLDLVGVLPFAHGQINVLRFSRSGDLLLAAGGRGGKSGKVVVYSVKSGEVMTELADEADAILAADLSPDQSEVAVGGPGRVVRVYATADGAVRHVIRKHTEWITAIEYSPDGKYLATADRNGGVILWEAATGREHHVLPGHKLAVTGLCWRDDSAIVASSSEDGSVKLWEPDDGKSTKTLAAAGAMGVRYGHDGRLATTGRDGKTRLFDANANQPRELVGVADVPLHVAVTHDQSRVLAGDWSGQVHVWQVSDGKKVGVVTTNPLTPAERLAQGRAELAKRQAEWEAAQASVTAATVAAQKADEELGRAKKVVADLKSTVGGAAERMTKLRQSRQQVMTETNAGKRDLAKIEDRLREAGRAVEKAQGQAEIEEAKKAEAAIRKEADECRKKQADLGAKEKSLTEEMAAVKKAREEAPAKMKAAQEAETARVKSAQAAGESLKAARARLDTATAARDAARALVERLSAEETR